eukprot:scaffold87279_cov18-Prasinocladus_malaysianus.AAC.1
MAKSLQIRFENGQTCQNTFGLSELWVRQNTDKRNLEQRGGLQALTIIKPDLFTPDLLCKLVCMDLNNRQMCSKLSSLYDLAKLCRRHFQHGDVTWLEENLVLFSILAQQSPLLALQARTILARGESRAV